MTPEQIEIVAKLKEIEEQAARLLEEGLPQSGPTSALAHTRVVHIANLATYLRSTIATELVLVKKKSELP